MHRCVGNGRDDRAISVGSGDYSECFQCVLLTAVVTIQLDHCILQDKNQEDDTREGMFRNVKAGENRGITVCETCIS
jgi:hypothetical protein